MNFSTIPDLLNNLLDVILSVYKLDSKQLNNIFFNVTTDQLLARLLTFVSSLANLALFWWYLTTGNVAFWMLW